MFLHLELRTIPFRSYLIGDQFWQGFKEKCHSVKSVASIAVSVLEIILVDFDKYWDEEACLEKRANKSTEI